MLLLKPAGHPLQPERVELGNAGHATGAPIGCKPHAFRGVTADLRDTGGIADELEEFGLFFSPLFAFFVLIVAGLYLGELSVKRAMIFVGIWGVARAAIGFFDLPPFSYVVVDALLDCVLILMIFGGDLKIR